MDDVGRPCVLYSNRLPEHTNPPPVKLTQESPSTFSVSFAKVQDPMMSNAPVLLSARTTSVPLSTARGSGPDGTPLASREGNTQEQDDGVAEKPEE